MNSADITTSSGSHDIDNRLELLGLDHAARQVLKEQADTVLAGLPGALDRLYELISATPEMARHFRDAGHMEQAKSAQVNHWSAILEADFDGEYVQRVKRIGSVHARIGLEPRWYIAGYACLTERIVETLLDVHVAKPGFLKKGKPAAVIANAINSTMKAIFLDMELSLSVYFEEAEKNRVAMEEAARRERELVTNAFADVMNAIAEKDLTKRLGNELPEDYADLVVHFNRALDELAGTIRNVEVAAESIKSGSIEIRTAADDLSSRAEQQAAAVEQTAAAFEQVTNAVESSRINAVEIGGVVNKAHDSAERSATMVATTIAAMERIARSSEDVARIISVIDEIAFQTNLLALNAGVEAARAGDAGRGFAVVAQEVRELAQRSATAANEIKELISVSRGEVRNGVEKVNSNGEALQEIKLLVEDVSARMKTMVSSSEEQATTLREIGTAIGSIDRTTQRNAALAEEFTAGTHALDREVVSIGEALAQFNCDTAQASHGDAGMSDPHHETYLKKSA
ncbi:MAG: globin-coupled sensor protein [Nitratireductor sp.]|nr:globin-coupled sensor protein [Nitratireductor sp.]MCC0020412.1 globin-coupled sensor protein [Nitratireductor sp.]